MKILIKRKGRHPEYVFTYQGHPISQANTKAWRGVTHSNERTLKTFVGTIYNTLGQAGTYKMELAYRSYNNANE